MVIILVVSSLSIACQQTKTTSIKIELTYLLKPHALTAHANMGY